MWLEPENTKKKLAKKTRTELGWILMIRCVCDVCQLHTVTWIRCNVGSRRPDDVNKRETHSSTTDSPTLRPELIQPSQQNTDQNLPPPNQWPAILCAPAPVAGPLNKGPLFVSLSFALSLFFLLPRLFYFLLISCTTYCTTHSHTPLTMHAAPSTHTGKHPLPLCVYSRTFDSLNAPFIFGCCASCYLTVITGRSVLNRDC